MGEHDEFCRYHEPCDCELIARVRSDEREQAAQRVQAVRIARPRSWEAAVAAARGEDEK